MLSPVADISPLTHASVSCFADNKSHDRILLSTALIKVKSENGVLQTCRALIDTGSQRCLITNSCRKKLNLPLAECKTTVFGLGNKLVEQSIGEVSLQFSPHFSNLIFNANPIVIDKITSELPNFFIEKDNWPYLKNLLLADPNFDKSSQIDLVIGAELAPCLFNGKVRFQNLSGPTACGSKLGWLLTGKILLSGENSNQDITMFASEEQDDFLEKFWELESVPSAKSLTREEISCEEIYINNLKILEDGRYSVGLPFRTLPTLGESRINALKRFLSLERKLQKSPSILKQYCDFMDEYLLINHMELIPSDELDTPSGQCYYIPHHCVFKEQSTTTKLRVVFDASCKTSNGKSLNDFLHVGPKLQQDIFNILIRFRTRPIAFSGDIEKMYRQVRIDSRDCDFQRILWRKNPSEPLLDYRLLTVTYGLSSGFSLRKWRSNVPEVLSGLSEQVEDRHNLRDFESDSCVKILGICWNPSLDIFQILVNDIPEQTNSKRHLLSHISRIFDPIGWLSPVIIRLKILLQSLWKQKLNWDDPLPDTLCSQWKKIEKELSLLNKIQIPRYFSCRGALLSVELHGFCDSSEVAYAAVFYIRSHFKSGQVKVSLIASKTRVAPLKMISIPRLELCAALLLATLYDTIRNSLCFQIDRVFLWTDSKIVLSWIKSESRHWKPFVGNRIAEIQRLTLHSSWHYVISKNNSADCASRGITPSELVDHSLWWRGPTWLSDVNFEDPIQTQYDFPKEISGERRKTFSVFHSTNLLFPDFIFKYSNINELVRITAWIYRFVFNVQCSYNERKKGHLSSSELKSSIHNIIRFIQSSEFQSEITCCKQKKSLPTNSRLLSLNPFIDESGLLRVGGRLRHSNLQFDEKHPIILPRGHFITELIVRQCHLDHLHSGLQLTMSALRLRYWIPAGRSLVKKIIHQCMVCFRAKRQVTKQIMGDLPMHRIVKSNPFTKTGIDFAGPFLMKPNIKRSKVKLKSYVALFVSFCTKAIHIEIVSDLSSAAFLAALKRFISRRGKPSDIFSDNGTNFRGANNILREQFDILKASTIQKFISNERINWHFIPPSAPNFGGIWEAGIKSFKFHLLRCLKSQILTFEELSTLTTQIEACLNSRPICPLSSDSDDFNPLTPGHFLIGRPLTALPESNDDDVPINYLDRWSLNKKIKNVFWKRWNREYLNNLQQRLKWQKSSPNIKEGDLILLKDTISPPAMYWSLGRITKVFPGADGKVRVVEMERFLIREGASDKQNQNENKEDKKIVKSTGNKRKYVEDYLKYGFIPSVNDPSLPFCLICQKPLSNETMVPSKLLRHIETNHREQMNNPISYFENIRSSFQKQSKKFKKFMTTSDEAQTVSYMIAQLIARKKKAHAEAEEIILPALKIVAGCMLTNDAMEKVTKIPLSSKTIARRIEDMSEDIELQIKQSFNDSSTKWAIQLDETTDISNKAQLLAFLRFVDTGKIVNNYFFCKELKQRTTGADIFELVDENVMKYNLRWENCVSVCTDGAPAMKGSRKGLIAHVIKKNPNIKFVHCMIHREMLVSKSVPPILVTTLDEVVKVVNYIKSNALRSIIFSTFCEAMDSDYKKLLFHTEVRWLSKGKVLNRFISMKNEIMAFIDNEEINFPFMMSDVWWLRVSFLGDIFDKLNSLNLNLQGVQENIITISTKLKAFKEKLSLWNLNIAKENFASFPMVQENPSKSIIKKEVEETLTLLSASYDKYFPYTWTLKRWNGHIHVKCNSTCVRSVVMKSNREFENRAATIVALRAGRSPKEILDFLNLPKTTIYRVKKQFDEADSNKVGIATRKKHSRRSDRVRGEEFVKNVKEKIDGNPGKSMRAIAKEMDVGSMTIVRTIHEDLGLKSYALRKGQLLTENMKNNRKGKAAALLNNLKHDSFGMLRSSLTKRTLTWTK
ncbi:hypothetical protein LAZ67_1004155, partial [Cordylochernes scorpioides]